MDFCNILNGFADFENTAECGLAENFGADFGLFMSGSSVDTFGSLWSVFVGMLLKLSQKQAMKKKTS